MASTDRNHKSDIDYGSISTMQELREAKLRLRGKLIIKKMEMSMEYDQMKEAVNPMTYIRRFLSGFSNLDVIYSSFRQGYDWISSFIGKNREKKETREAGENPTESYRDEGSQSGTDRERSSACQIRGTGVSS